MVLGRPAETFSIIRPARRACHVTGKPICLGQPSTSRIGGWDHGMTNFDQGVEQGKAVFFSNSDFCLLLLGCTEVAIRSLPRRPRIHASTRVAPVRRAKRQGRPFYSLPRPQRQEASNPKARTFPSMVPGWAKGRRKKLKNTSLVYHPCHTRGLDGGLAWSESILGYLL